MADFEGQGDTAPPLGDPDHLPAEKPDPLVKNGDVWALGPHRLMVGDSLQIKLDGPLLEGRPVDAVWTDPPYNVNYQSKHGDIANDSMPGVQFRAFLSDAFKAVYSCMADGAAIYVAHADTEGLNFRSAFTGAGFKLSGCLVWVKPSLVLGRSDYQWRHEPILYGWRPGAAHSWYGGRTRTTVLDGQDERVRVMPDGTVQVDVGGQVLVVSGSDLSLAMEDQSVLRFSRPGPSADHLTMKPVALIEEMLGNSTQAGDVVLDPFAGSGSTLIACHSLGRVARVVEFEPRYGQVILERFETYAGIEPVRSDGVSLSALREKRGAA